MGAPSSSRVELGHGVDPERLDLVLTLWNKKVQPENITCVQNQHRKIYDKIETIDHDTLSTRILEVNIHQNCRMARDCSVRIS
jgi:hypothetical protein